MLLFFFFFWMHMATGQRTKTVTSYWTHAKHTTQRVLKKSEPSIILKKIRKEKNKNNFKTMMLKGLRQSDQFYIIYNIYIKMMFDECCSHHETVASVSNGDKDVQLLRLISVICNKQTRFTACTWHATSNVFAQWSITVGLKIKWNGGKNGFHY